MKWLNFQFAHFWTFICKLYSNKQYLTALHSTSLFWYAIFYKSSSASFAFFHFFQFQLIQKVCFRNCYRSLLYKHLILIFPMVRCLFFTFNLLPVIITITRKRWKLLHNILSSNFRNHVAINPMNLCFNRIKVLT